MGFITLLQNSDRRFHVMVYVLVVTTFLNQSVIQLDIGFFSLFLYRIMLILAATVFLVHLVANRNLADYWEHVHVKGPLIFLLLWLSYGFASLVWAYSFVDAIKYLFLLGLGVVFVFLAVFTFTTMPRLYFFYAIWMGMTLLLLGIGLINHYLQFQLPTSSLYGASDHKLGYPTAVFFNQNDFATFLTISFFFYLAVARNGKQMWLKTICLVLSGLTFYIISLTESRAGVLAVVVGLLSYLFLLVPPIIKKIMLATGTIAVIGAAVLIVPSIIGNEPIDASSNAVRLNLLKNTFHYVVNTYGFGVGAGNLPVYLEYQPVYETHSILEVHNWLAEIAGNFGILVLLGYVTMYGYLFSSLYRIYRNRTQHKALLEGLMITLIAFLVASISPSSVSNLYFHWVYLGFVLSAVSVFKREEMQGIQEKPY
ncbi:O-antigen ligase family protein [Mesobacillus maritimus]|uniref:teichuronic acid biosynthesis protein TuaE n=1 Tax=Mesobacillus maritimus TaxID=1643336 RepID=UPI002041C724|nr:O-antigen ligase family protein [Mesobacillus maritimus]MCM3668140.1 O-antigen ligase family protein [Mesobacillus maritimus]